MIEPISQRRCLTWLLVMGISCLFTACYPSPTPTVTPTAQPLPEVSKVPCSAQLPQSECAALFELIGKEVPAPCEKAEHISCDDGHITRIDFRWAHAYGYKITDIPASIGDLPFLTELRLFGNYQLAGTLPPELFTLEGLEILDIGDTHLGGGIPDALAKLSNLRYLNLDMNDLVGAIPPELGQLSKLEYLHLFGNLLAGSIPPDLGNLTNLRELHLGHNQLTGPIPPEIGNLSQLQRLYLHDNQLSGRIPPELGNLHQLQDLYLRQNRLTGVLPPEFAQLDHLVRLDVSLNTIRGELPDHLSPTVQQFWFHETQLSEPVPAKLRANVPFTSAVVRYEDFDCASVTTLPRWECEALLAVYLPSDANAGYYLGRDGGRRSSHSGARFDRPGVFDEGKEKWLEYPVFVAPDPCRWFVVNCKDGHVRSLDLSDPLPESYQLPPEVVNFTYMRYLWLGEDTSICYPAGYGVEKWLSQLEFIGDARTRIRACDERL